MIDLNKLKAIIEVDFADIIEKIEIYEINEMRIYLMDKTFINIWFSLKLVGRYSYHWERKFKNGSIYRHNNIPHKKWNNIKTFPKHFHNNEENNVTESNISEDITKGVTEFLKFVRKKIKQKL